MKGLLRELETDELESVVGGFDEGYEVPPAMGDPAFDRVRDTFSNYMAFELSDWNLDIRQDPNQPWLLERATRENSTCPTGHTCVPVDNTNGMYVRDISTNTFYFSEYGWQRYESGANIDWWGVAEDLLLITGGSLGGVGAGVAGIISGFLALGGWAVDYWRNDGG